MEREFKLRNLNICPKCGSDDIEGDSIEGDYNICWQRVVCNSCSFEWEDLYEYTMSTTKSTDDLPYIE